MRSLHPMFFLAALLLVAGGCAPDHDLGDVVNPRDPGVSGLMPPVPSAPEAIVGNRFVELTWALPDSELVADVSYYRIYRAKGDDELAPADTAMRPPARLDGLVNGTEYDFAVAAVLDNGLEGRRSPTTNVVPGVFGVQIEGGREATRTAIVQITLLAPDEVTGMEVANENDFTYVPVQPYAGSLNWQLAPGDGEKEVFVRFTDREGNLSVTVSDRILLDGKAEILAVTFAPLTARPGETVRFRLEAGEPNGEASVQLGAGGRTIELRDDGASGDALADDGIYSLDYDVPPDLALVDALVTGRFTDRTGNEAPNQVASGRLNVVNDPPAVELAPIVSPGPGELFLTWTQAPDPGRFSSYRIFRAEAAGVDTSRTRVLAREVSSRTQTTFTDSGLDPNRTYYYRVHVVDGNGLSSSSNEESGRPRLSPPPDPVTLGTPANVSETTVSLNFSRSLSPEFAQYRVWRGEQADLESDPKRRLLASLSSAETTTYDDRTELEQGMTYYYRVDVVDRSGQATQSNVVTATIPDPPPAAVTLNGPGSTGETAVLLTWGESNERDFERYELRRSSEAGVGPDSPLLASPDQKEETSFLDTGLTENTDYYYRVFVVDKGGNRTGSNELQVTTENADPPAVALAAPVEVSGAITPSVTLSWGRSGAHDFEEYRLFRDTAPAVGEGSTLIRAIADQDILTFLDSGLTDNTRYYYRVFVRDDAGGSTGSNEQSVVTANRPPTPVTLNVGLTTRNSIQLTWTQNANHDFNEYRLLQGTSSTSFPTTVVSLTQREQTSHTIFYADGDSTQYFFKVTTYDKALESGARLSTDSNVVSARTARN